MQNLFSVVTLIVILCGFVLRLPAQSMVAQPYGNSSVQGKVFGRNQTAVALLERALDLMAPPSVRTALHSASVNGVVTSATDPLVAIGKFSLRFADNNFQLESTTSSYRRRYSYVDGAGRIDVNGQLGPAKISHVSDLYSDVVPLFDAWSSSLSRDISGIELGGDQVVDGTQCREVTLRTPLKIHLLGHQTHDVNVFVSVQTGLLVAIDYPATQTPFYSESNRMKVSYGQYQLLDGVYIPTLIHRYMNGHALPVLRIHSISVHETIDKRSLAF